MKRLSRNIGIGALLLLFVLVVVVWSLAFRVPSMDRLTLPAELIPAESDEGQQLLAQKEFTADYDPLRRNFESQTRPAYCGVASSVVVLNALQSPEPRITQSTFFTEAASNVQSALETTFGGMTLAQLGDLLRAHDVEVTTYYAADTGVDSFRTIAEQNLKSAGDFLLVNYQRGVLGQKATGHISPIAAYNAATDRMLILDVAAYRYPPVWVSTAALWDAMNTKDDTSGRTRGFAVVRGSAPAP
ncbi:MAG: phytochelatin synthase family protein [Rhodanobacteraceae bacterium]